MKTNRRTTVLGNTNWDSNIKGIVVLQKNYNAHSPEWNVYCCDRKDAAGLERLVDTLDLILNNKQGKATRPTNRMITSVIKLTFPTLDIGALDT